MEYEGIYRRRRDPIRIESIEQLGEFIKHGFRHKSGIPLEACRDLVAAIEEASESDWPTDIDRNELLKDKDELAILTEDIDRLLGTKKASPDLIGMRCFKLGRLVERILVRQFEVYVQKGGKFVDQHNERPGGRSKSLSDAEKAEAVKMVHRLEKEGIDRTVACDRVASFFKERGKPVSKSTIYRYFKASL